MIKLKCFGRLIAMTIVMLALGGCAGPKLMVQPVAVLENPTAAVSQLESKLAEARQNQVNVLSPTWFTKAEGSLAEAKKLQDNKGEISRIAQTASRGLTEINQAEVVARLVHSTIPDAIEGRRLARTAGATSLGEDYTTVEKLFLGLTRDVENNDLKKAKKSQPDLLM